MKYRLVTIHQRADGAKTGLYLTYTRAFDVWRYGFTSDYAKAGVWAKSALARHRKAYHEFSGNFAMVSI